MRPRNAYHRILIAYARDRSKFAPTPTRKEARFKRRNAILAGQNWRNR